MGNTESIKHKLQLRLISDKYVAKDLLDKAEKDDRYPEECFDDKANMAARRNMTYAPNQISLRDFNYGQSYVESIKEQIPLRLLLELDEVKIIQLMPTADGGMPHTRPGNIICYPDISQLFSSSTLIHELWHIHQRQFQDVWHKVFKRIGWMPWSGTLPEQLENNRRYNPDTIDSPLWVYENKWVPIPIFRDITHPKVGDVDIWFYDIQKNYHVKRVPDEIAAYYGNLSPAAFEHPREITAYMLSEPKKHGESIAFKHLLESIGHTSINIGSTN